MKKIITFMICTLFLLAVGLCSCSSDDENATPTTRLDKGVLTDWQLEIADYFVSNNCGFQLWRLLYKGQYYYWFSLTMMFDFSDAKIRVNYNHPNSCL